MSVLIDSSVWINWIRSRVDPRPIIKPWVLKGACFTCGIIRLEVLRGIVDAKQRAKFEDLFDTFQHVALEKELIDGATHRAWSLDRKGVVLGATDLLIAECAIQRNSWLVTLDGDFKKIPGLRIRATLPNEAGSRN